MITSDSPVSEMPHVRESILAWLTIERLAWIVIGVAAAAIRLAGLGARVFDPAEAQQAVAALGAAGLPAAGTSPL
ncbi:MAG: hypothetical protein KDI55_28310, partial [Anaerolineae bacterium]|nr:hypothetical protein [Anaerolineae bacterium]